MISVVCGFGAAGLWGSSTLLLAVAARGGSARSFGFWFLITQGLVVLIPGCIAALTSAWPRWGIAAVVLAAVAEAAAMVAYRNALRQVEVAVVAPLVALEGAVAAVLALIAGEPLSMVVAAGLVLAVVGGVVVGIPSGTTRLSRGSGNAVLTAVLFGVTLWLLAESDLEPLLALLLFNLLSAAFVLAMGGASDDAPRVLPSRREFLILLGAGTTSGAGLLVYMLGARAGSVAVTAVIGAQFSVIAVVGGYLRFGERLGRRQLAGIAGLLLGVGLVAAGSG